MLPNVFEALICIPSRPPSIASFPSEKSATVSSSKSSTDEPPRFVFVRRKLHPERDKKTGIRWKFRNGRVVLLERGKKKKSKKPRTKGTGLFRRVLSDITMLSENGTESVLTEGHSSEGEDDNDEEAQNLVEPTTVLSDRGEEEKEGDDSDHEGKEDHKSNDEGKEGDNNDDDSPSIYSQPSHDSDFEADTTLIDSDYTPGRTSPYVRMYAGVAGDGTRRPLYLASSPPDRRPRLEKFKASTFKYWHAVVKVTKKGGKWILSELHLFRTQPEPRVESKAHTKDRQDAILLGTNELYHAEHPPPSVDEARLRAEPNAHITHQHPPIPRSTTSVHHPEHVRPSPSIDEIRLRAEPHQNPPILRPTISVHHPEHLSPAPSVDETRLRAEPRAHNTYHHPPILRCTTSLHAPEQHPRSTTATARLPASTTRRFTIFKSAALGRPRPTDRFWILSKRRREERKLMHPHRNATQMHPDSPTMVVSTLTGTSMSGSALLGVAPTFSVRRKPVPVGAGVVGETGGGMTVNEENPGGSVAEEDVASTLAGTTVVGHERRDTVTGSIAGSTLSGPTVVDTYPPHNAAQRNTSHDDDISSAVEREDSVIESGAAHLGPNTMSANGNVHNPTASLPYPPNVPNPVEDSHGSRIPESVQQHSGRVSPVEQVYGRNSVNFRMRAEANDVSSLSDAQTVVGEGDHVL